jgi:formylglycine-generating enzyme required for sulfatase activity
MPANNSASSQLKVPKTEVGTFVQIPEGEYMMGSEKDKDDENSVPQYSISRLEIVIGEEKPVHQVKISSFEIGKYELTQEQWQSVMGRNPSEFIGANLPVEKVSWNDAQEFIKKLNARNDGYTYRLPTEAEWEYACRAGSTGDYAGKLDEMAWYRKNSDNKTHPVGQKKPNAWGLHDMHGNVWEWCLDWSGNYSESQSSNPAGSRTGIFRVIRGDGYLRDAAGCRSAFRNGYSPIYSKNDLGLRLVRTYN